MARCVVGEDDCELDQIEELLELQVGYCAWELGSLFPFESCEEKEENIMSKFQSFCWFLNLVV